MVGILYNIRSLHNVGSMFRTADAAGIEKLYLVGITPSPLDRFHALRIQLTKVSLGAEKTVPWEVVSSLSRLLTRLKKDRYTIVALELSPKAIPYYDYAPKKGGKEKIVLIVGNEVEGIPGEILKKCDRILEIPMRGTKESLNVAVSFGVAAFHFRDCKQ